MKISEFNYNLPNELIATHPIEPRDTARMLVMDRNREVLHDKHFYDLSDILWSGDVLVFNDSKVIPARLTSVLKGSDFFDAKRSDPFKKPRTFEVLLIKNLEGSTWECWLKPGKKAKVGDIFVFSDNLTAEYIRRENDIFIIDFNLSSARFFSEIAKIGEMPIPPYIVKARQIENQNSKLEDSLFQDDSDYQTVYAKVEGSVAAPTAGLHFTEELLQKLRNKGVQLEYLTLHVGLGTFQPVTTENVEDFHIHSEYYEISNETAKRLNLAKAEGRRIIAVGTTSVRVLESASRLSGIDLNLKTQNSKLVSLSGDTSIYIYPGYSFKFVDSMITNFHLPNSSLMLLVSAFASKEQILAAYVHAVEGHYRFYSYGDGMFIS